MTEKHEKCYYESYQICGSKLSSFSEKACPGKEKCSRFISEDDYFAGLMSGTIKAEKVTEDPVAKRKRIESALRPEKSKKQLKREAKLEEAKLGDGTGFKLGDNPALQSLFKELSTKNETANNKKK